MALLLRQLREHRGLPRSTAENLAQVGFTLVSRYENAGATPPWPALKRMCTVYEVDPYKVIRQAYLDSLKITGLPVPPALTVNPEWLLLVALLAHHGQSPESLPFAQWCCGDSLSCKCQHECACECTGCHAVPVALPPTRRALVTGGKPSRRQEIRRVGRQINRHVDHLIDLLMDDGAEV